VNFFNSAAICLLVLVVCGCDRGQATSPVSTTPEQGTSAVPAADFAATKKDAESGDAMAQYNLGVMYHSGEGVPQDHAEAAKWYRLAADQGNFFAQETMGMFYYNGLGVPQDYAEALKWFRLVADQGNAEGQRRLGMMYDEGKGVPQDDTQAMKWFRLAADQGNCLAQLELGERYRDGEGVPQDFIEAYSWFAVAAICGDTSGTYLGVLIRDDAAKARDAFAEEFTPQVLSQAQRRATELFEKISSGK
jgi:TPR repeat protein